MNILVKMLHCGPISSPMTRKERKPHMNQGFPTLVKGMPGLTETQAQQEKENN